ncbi:MAG: asparagine synthase (glutamine-hydrolyzing) [Christiangramia sp.]|nr:asparagine synthase (glutamine-hydrolyzing) [Christiangramia sp.]
MCGINGILQLNSTCKEAVQRMNTRLAHRGPDDEGVFAEDGVALGQRRLSIIDLSSAGHQPMQSLDGRFILIFNGEIYNFRELKKELDYPFVSGTDSEVILAAYIKWGRDCVSKFNGMFAFAIWDIEKKELFIARDRLGIKPLYFYRNNEVLVFSSEIRALISSGKFPAKLSKEGLVDYLKYQTVHAPNTILEDVFMMTPGSTMTLQVKNGQFDISSNTYWKPGERKNELKDATYAEAKDSVKNHFFKAVESRLVADVPFGAFLSGGIDSSAVVGVMSQIADKQVKTFNISFAEEEFSEAKYARIIAKKFGTDHHEIQLSPEHFLKQIPDALKSMDHPSGDGPNTWVVSRATREAGITMALSGLGGDELFAGYPIFRRLDTLNKRQWLWKAPEAVRRSAGSVLQKVKPGIASDKIKSLLALNTYDFADVYSLSRQVLMNDQVTNLLNFDTTITTHFSKELLSSHEILPNSHFLSRISIAEINTYMQNVLLRDSDQMSMAHALEVRVPFLDHELVELALSIPDNFKFPVTPKKMLIDSLGDLLPTEIIDRPKMGFTFPWEHWLKNDLFELADQAMKNIAERDYFNSDAILKLWEDFNNGHPSVTYSRIWPLVVLDSWMKENNIE